VGCTKEGAWAIYKSTDDWKDQTYFLFTVPPEVIPYLLFPVGGMDKQKVRKIAEEKGLCVSAKKDSTGLCFIGTDGYATFIEKQLRKGKRALPSYGPVRLISSGEIIGQHKGLYSFTYGQRKGLGVSFADQALYVVKIDTKNNTLWLGEDKLLYSSKAFIDNIHWLDERDDGERLRVKIRFHHVGCWTRIYKKKDSCVLEFETPQRAVTPGQAAVLYKNNQLVGGGSISHLS